jgi:BioD-like phosphotransacetylase family protein
VEEVFDDIKGKVVHGGEHMQRKVKKVIVGAMTPSQALDYFTDSTLVITPGDREALVLTVVCEARYVVGLILTGQVMPHDSVMNILSTTQIPVAYAAEDTYTVAARVRDMMVKIHPHDIEKVETAVDIIGDCVAIDRILEKL